MRALLIATRNEGKIREVKEILKDLPFKLLTLDDIEFNEEIPETGRSFSENAVLKAKIIGKKREILTLAEDSGLEVDALQGRPGVNSARYGKGSDKDRVNKLLEELKEVKKRNRTARFRAVVAIYNPFDKTTKTFEGESEGYITDCVIGNNGFGYDPVFYNLDLGKTNAQVTLEEKNEVSHRARALEKAKKYLNLVLRTNEG